jgi:hypothetical protein
MDSVRNEERAGVPSERVGARQKQRGYRAPRPAPRPRDRTRLIDAGASRRRTNLDSGGSRVALSS